MPVVELKAGFAKPWIVWDTDTNEVTVDGRRVPCTLVACGRCDRHEHAYLYRCHDDEPCVSKLTGKLCGFEMAFHLENGLVAVAVMDNESSSLWLSPDFEKGGSFLRTETGVVIDPDCEGYEESGCYHDCLFDQIHFETYEDVMAKLKEWSGWTVDVVSPVG